MPTTIAPPQQRRLQVLGQDPARLVVVAATLSWCRACRSLKPKLQLLAQHYQEVGLSVVCVCMCVHAQRADGHRLQLPASWARCSRARCV